MSGLPDQLSSREVFIERSHASGILIWERNTQSGSVSLVPGWGDRDAIIGCRAVVDQLESVWTGWSRSEEPLPERPRAGVWVVPLLAGRESASQPVRKAAMLLETTAMDPELVSEIAACLSLEPRVVSAALDALPRHDPSAIARLLKIVQWLYDDRLADERNRMELASCGAQLCDTYEQMSLLYHVAQMMNSSSEPRAFVHDVCDMLRETLQFDWVGVRFGPIPALGRQLMNELVVAGEVPCSIPRFDGIASRLVQASEPDEQPRVLAPGGEELATAVGAEVFMNAVTCDGQLAGLIVAGNRYGDDPFISTTEMQLISASADYLSVFVHNAALYAEQRAMFMGTVRALSATIDAKDGYTRGHSERVAHVAGEIAVQLGMDETQVERVRLAGLLHDLGKIGVPEAVLLKPGRLTEEEFEAIKLHPTIGYNILKDIEPLQDVLPGVLYHHERWDGEGYPRGLKGTQIPMLGRILAVADSFDAMSSDRAYRPRLEREHVLNEFREKAGHQWDKHVVREFLKVDLVGYDKMLTRHSRQESRLSDLKAA